MFMVYSCMCGLPSHVHGALHVWGVHGKPKKYLVRQLQGVAEG